jgi:hypothetical protein
MAYYPNKLTYAVYEGVLEIPALRGGMFHPDGD